MSETFWFFAGIPVGTLGLMQYQVWRARRHRHPMQVDLKFLAPTPPTIEEELEEMVTFMPTPAVRSTLQKCTFCGKEYKRVSQHIRMSHKTHDIST